MTKLSVIVPAYNEANTILPLLRKVSGQDIPGVELEVIVVDDGSTDATPQLLTDNSDLYSEYVRLEKNGGKGAAAIAGLERATGEFVLFQDADLEYDPNDYASLMEPVQKYGADMVMGSRVTAPRLVRVIYFWHKVGNRLITLFFNVMHNTTFTDVYSCYLMFRRSLVDPKSLRSRGWEQQAEILSIAARRANVIYEVPISYHGRPYGEGKKIRAWHMIPVLWMIFAKRVFG